MRAARNRRYLLRARPTGAVDAGCFELVEGPVPEPPPGGALVRVDYLSIDPTIRGWIERDTYLPAIAIGDVIRSGGAGEVVASEHPGFPVGTRVFGMLGWQDYAVLDADTPAMAIPDGIELTDALSVYGITGLTAYFGLFDVARIEPGETVVVSGAAGGVGSVAGQIARIHGCRVVGIAGTAEKCAWVVDDLGFDACIDYRTEDVNARLRGTCPDGVDVYFDNVGGEILDAVLGHINLRARVALCGAISGYDSPDLPPGPRNIVNLIPQRARLEGFLLLDYQDRFLEAILKLGEWVASGQLVSRVDLVDGLPHAPQALQRLFTGANVGKVLVATGAAEASPT